MLVTGGAGFLGSHLVRRLLRLGARVAVLEHPAAGLQRLAECRESVQLVRADLGNAAAVHEAVRDCQPQILFHLAAYGVDPAHTDLDAMVRTNVLGLQHLLDAVTGTGCRVINTGTCFEYGNQPRRLSERSRLQPLNAYAASKIMAWQLCQLDMQRTGTSIVTLRLFTFFGPGERPDRLIPSTIAAILRGEAIRITEGRQTRDYTYVEDVAEAYVRAAVTPEATGQTINVGSGTDRSVRDVVTRIRRLMRSEVPVLTGAVPMRSEEAWRLRADRRLAAKVLGWKPRTSFEAGLHLTIRWMRQQNSFGRARAANRRVSTIEALP